MHNLHLPTVIAVSAVMMILVAIMTTLFGRTQQVYQGFRWWMAAQWLAAIGVSLQLFAHDVPALRPVSVLLMLQWPALVLVGLRRFHPRAALPGSFATDILLVALVALAWLAASVSSVPLQTPVIVMAVGNALLHLYAVWVLHHLPVESRPAPVVALQVLLVLAALMQVVPVTMALWMLPQAQEFLPAMAGVVLPLALDAVATLILCTVLTHDRTQQTLQASQTKLRMLANMDSLTSMPNRRHFRELADRMIGRSTDLPPAVMLFDIDHFKQVNDVHGHAVGDEALLLVARSTRTTFRTKDVVGRLGGDEFVALMPATTVEDAMRVADRMVRHVSRGRADYPRVPALSLSFGVVCMEPGERFEDALKRADEALYEAKRQGRGCAVSADTEYGQTVFGESRPMGLDGLHAST